LSIEYYFINIKQKHAEGKEGKCS